MVKALTPRRGFSSPGFEQGKLSEHDAMLVLTDLASQWPSHLWLFAASGSLCVMQCRPNGERAMLDGGGVDPAYLVATIGIPCDGGDW